MTTNFSVRWPSLILCSLFCWTPEFCVAQARRSAETTQVALGQHLAEQLAAADRLFWLRNYQEAKPLFAEVQVLAEKEHDARNALYAEVSIFMATPGRLTFPEVSAYLASKLDDSVTRGDPKLRLRCLIVKGFFDEQLDVEATGPTWREVQSLAASVGDEGWRDRAAIELAIGAFLRGDLYEALNLIHGGYNAAKATHDVAGQVRSLSLMAGGLSEIGRDDQAIEYADQALKIAATERKLGFPVTAYTAKIQSLLNLHRLVEAQRLVKESIAATRPYIHQCLELLIDAGRLAQAEGQSERAILYYKDAMQLAWRYKLPRPYSAAATRLTELNAAQDQLDEARRCIAAGLRANRQLGDLYILPTRLALAGDIAARLGQRRTASGLFAEATDLAEAMMIHVPTITLKSTVIAFLNNLYVKHFKLLMKSPAAAFQVIEQARSTVTADYVYAIQAVHPSSSPSISAQKQVTAIQVRLLRATSAGERRRLLDLLRQAEDEMAPEEFKIARELPMARLKPSLAASQASLRNDEVVLEFVLDQPESYCLAFNRDRATIVTLASAKDVERSAEEYIALLANKKVDKRLGAKLYEQLIGPIAPSVLRRRLIVVPAGKLNFLPFEALVKPNGQYVLEDHILSYTPSASLLRLDRLDRVPHPPLAVLALAPSGGPIPQEESAGEVASGLFRGLFDIRGAQYNTLPYSTREVLDISREVRGKSKFLIGPAATEAAFKAEPLNRYRVIHLALHSAVERNYPDRTALLFAPATHPQEDGLLQSREVRHLRLNAELVTLSACDTTIGKIEGQAGVANLVHSFLLAGSKSVLATIWPVDDAGSASLMKHFYHHIANGDDKGSALWAAKREMMGRDPANPLPPYFWAGFVLMGDSLRVIPL